MKNWKITNTSIKQIKLAVAVSSHGAPGVILQPGQFCLSTQQMTAPIDAQMRRGLIEIDKEFDNSELKLELAKAYDKDVIQVEKIIEFIKEETILDIAVKETEGYQKDKLTNNDLGNIIW